MVYEAGKKLGNYQLLKLLGQGGNADVYLGKHIYLKSLAAIKVLRVRLNDDDEVLQQFITEARTIVRLKHPHIISVLEFGIEEGDPYLVMDYAPHGSLRALHPIGRSLPATTVLAYVKPIADALEYAHENKIIHRDVKPENILLGADESLLLSDFGIALTTQSMPSNPMLKKPQTADIRGTTTYMAPEMFVSIPSFLSDQYSLGIVAYEWLSGQPPFLGSDMEVALQHVHIAPKPLQQRVPDLPESISQVVMRAIEKKPDDRYPSMSDFSEAFEDACQNAGLSVVANTKLALPGGDSLATSLHIRAMTAQVPAHYPQHPQHPMKRSPTSPVPARPSQAPSTPGNQGPSRPPQLHPLQTGQGTAHPSQPFPAPASQSPVRPSQLFPLQTGQGSIRQPQQQLPPQTEQVPARHPQTLSTQTGQGPARQPQQLPAQLTSPHDTDHESSIAKQPLRPARPLAPGLPYQNQQPVARPQPILPTAATKHLFDYMPEHSPITDPATVSAQVRAISQPGFSPAPSSPPVEEASPATKQRQGQFARHIHAPAATPVANPVSEAGTDIAASGQLRKSITALLASPAVSGLYEKSRPILAKMQPVAAKVQPFIERLLPHLRQVWQAVKSGSRIAYVFLFRLIASIIEYIKSAVRALQQKAQEHTQASAQTPATPVQTPPLPPFGNGKSQILLPPGIATAKAEPSPYYSYQDDDPHSDPTVSIARDDIHADPTLSIAKNGIENSIENDINDGRTAPSRRLTQSKHLPAYPQNPQGATPWQQKPPISSQHLATTHFAPPPGAMRPPAVQQDQQLISRRSLLWGIGAVGVAGLAGIVGWHEMQLHTQQKPDSAPQSSPTARATATQSTPTQVATNLQTINSTRPALATWGEGQLDLFVRGSDGNLWHQHYANGSWQQWGSVQSGMSYDPAAVAWGNARFDVFARGSDSTLQHSWYDGNWHPWESLGGGMSTDPAVISWGTNRLDVFARGNDNALYHKWYDGTWHDWENLGGVNTSAPAATTWGPNRMDVFERGTDNALWHRAYDGSWHDWESLGGTLNGDPGAVAMTVNRIDVFVRDNSNTIIHRTYDGTWESWDTLSGTLTSSPTAVSWGNNRIDLFGRDANNRILQGSYDGSWHPWVAIS